MRRQKADAVWGTYPFELSTLAISYHPSRRAMVEQALAELTAKLGNTPGIALVHALQQSREPGKD